VTRLTDDLKLANDSLGKLTEQSGQMTSIDSRVTSIDGRVAALEGLTTPKPDQVNGSGEIVPSTDPAEDPNASWKAELQRLHERIGSIETRLAGGSAEKPDSSKPTLPGDQTPSEISALKARLDQLEKLPGQFEDLAQRIDAAETKRPSDGFTRQLDQVKADLAELRTTVEDRLEALPRRVAKLEARMPTVGFDDQVDEWRTKLDALESQVEDVTKWNRELDGMQETVAALQDRLKLVEHQPEDVPDLEKRLADLSLQLKGHSEDIVALDRKLEGAIDTAHWVPGAGDDDSADSTLTAELRVENATRKLQNFKVNGTVYALSPGTHILNVPYGTVTTELVGREAPKIWPASKWKRNGDRMELTVSIR
jgi:chromosome segregation ATPase